MAGRAWKLLLALLGVWLLAAVPLAAQDEVLPRLSKLADLHSRRVTLLWLADKRNEALVVKAVAALEPTARARVATNVAGPGKKLFLENLDRAAACQVKALVDLLSADAFARLGQVLDAVDAVEPAGLRAAFLDLLVDLKTRVDFAALHGEGEDLRQLQERLGGSLEELRTLAAQDPFKLGRALYGGLPPDQVPVWWFDDANDPSVLEEEEGVTAGEAGAQLDLATATEDELAKVPGVGPATAAKIVAYREAMGGFIAVSELRRLEGLGEARYRKLAPLVKVTPTKKAKRQWTVMVFVNADNDLELPGLLDLNEMEAVGSSPEVNVVVQVDRMRSGNRNTTADGNWTGCRRYYMLQDADPAHVTSPIIRERGEVDMGSSQELADFGRFCVEYFPAERYLLAVWNHGMGWQGISHDQQSDNSMTSLELMQGIDAIVARLREVQPDKKRLDVVDLDACLMSLVEVGWQLRSSVDVLVASQLEEPGFGMPYDQYLAELVAHPKMEPKRLASFMVEAMVKSYAAGGSQVMEDREDADQVTKAAVALDRLEPLVEAVKELRKRLEGQFALYSKLLNENGSIADNVRTFNDENVDLYDLAATLMSFEGCPKGVQTACQRIRDVLGCPREGADTIDQPFVVKRRAPGTVLWSVNGGMTPPEALRGEESPLWHSRLASTKLQGPDELGSFAAELGPFVLFENPDTGRDEQVRSVEYQVLSDSGRMSKKFVVCSSKDYRVSKSFAEGSPLVAEGHTRGVGRSHGLSIYLPYPLQYDKAYGTLAFDKATGWGGLVSRVPVYEPTSSTLLVSEGETGRLALALRGVGLEPDALASAALYGFKYKDILARHAPAGLVVADGLSPRSLGKEAADPEDLKDYLSRGGKLLVIAQEEPRVNLFTPFFSETVGAEYLDDAKGPVKLTVPGAVLGSFTVNEKERAGVTVLARPVAGAEALAVTDDGRAAAVGRTVGTGAVVWLGFRPEDVADVRARLALLRRVVDFLGVKPAKRPK